MLPCGVSVVRWDCRDAVVETGVREGGGRAQPV